MATQTNSTQIKITKSALKELLDDLQEDYRAYMDSSVSINHVLVENPNHNDKESMLKFVQAKHRDYLNSRKAILALID
jgi:molybdenum cofactor biosynthesis enzyme MoaA